METIIQARHYRFERKTEDGSYHFTTEPEKVSGAQETSVPTVETRGLFISISGEGDLDAAGIEQKRKDLEEIDVLRQRNARELFRVVDSEVNGKPSDRLYFYKYVLADRRTEVSPEVGDNSFSTAQMEADGKQIAELRQRGQREITSLIEVEVGGQSKRSLGCRYLLSDGRKVTTFDPDPELPGPVPLTFQQEVELTRLVVYEKKGKFLGSTEVQVLGRAFRFSDTPSHSQMERS